MGDAVKYLETLIGHNPQLGDHFNQLIDLHKRRLWHQLGIKLNEFIQLPDVQQTVDLVQFYTQFVKSFEARLNQLTLTRLVVTMSKQIKNLEERIKFLQNLTQLQKAMENNEAYVYARSVLAELHLNNNNLPEAKTVLDEAKTKLDETTGADADVFSSYHRSWALYYKANDEPANFFSTALQYLGYTQLESITKEERVGLAFDLGLAALLGERLYNFGELIQNPILNELKDSNRAWLGEVLVAFNNGDINAWKQVQQKYASELNQQQSLKDNHMLLDEKISILSTIDLVFNKPSEDRRVKFNEISKASGRSEDKVELLVMRAFSLGLIKGTIDEVDKVVEVTWVQPRTLSIAQIGSMRSRLATWSSKVKDALTLMENEMTPELIA